MNSKTTHMKELLRSTDSRYRLSPRELRELRLLMMSDSGPAPNDDHELVNLAKVRAGLRGPSTNAPGLLRELDAQIAKQDDRYSVGTLHYPQATGIGCSVSCLMMALSALERGYKPRKEEELRLVRKLTGPEGLVELYNLVSEAVDHDLDVVVYSEIDYTGTTFDDPSFERRRKAYTRRMRYLQSYAHFSQHAGEPLTRDVVDRALREGRVVLINGTAGGYFHMRLVCGYDERQLIVSDPLSHEKTLMSYEALIKVSSPKFGRWLMALGPARRG